jgi:TolA-binding protein
MKTVLAVFMLAIAFVAAVPATARADANQVYLDGLSLYQEGKYTEAERKFMQALGQNPRHLSSLFMMGETLSKII